jgi:hypothetical protein
MVGLSCVSCGKEIAENEAEFFSKVLICHDCKILADRMHLRGEQTISLLSSMLQLSIRQAILDGKLQFHARALGEPADVDFLGELSRMVQQVRYGTLLPGGQRCPTPPSTSSRESTSLRVSIADGKPRSG